METFTCPDCGLVTRSPLDVQHRFCARCVEFKPVQVMLTAFQVEALAALRSYDGLRELRNLVARRRMALMSLVDIHTELSGLAGLSVITATQYVILARVLDQIAGFCPTAEKIQ